MFSGLTNQVSNWMGKKPEDGTEAEGGVTEAEAAVPIADPSVDPEAAAAGGGGRFVVVPFLFFFFTRRGLLSREKACK